jgi:hypothetical protein
MLEDKQRIPSSMKSMEPIKSSSLHDYPVGIQSFNLYKRIDLLTGFLHNNDEYDHLRESFRSLSANIDKLFSYIKSEYISSKLLSFQDRKFCIQDFASINLGIKRLYERCNITFDSNIFRNEDLEVSVFVLFSWFSQGLMRVCLFFIGSKTIV